MLNFRHIPYFILNLSIFLLSPLLHFHPCLSLPTTPYLVLCMTLLRKKSLRKPKSFIICSTTLILVSFLPFLISCHLCNLLHFLSNKFLLTIDEELHYILYIYTYIGKFISCCWNRFCNLERKFSFEVDESMEEKKVKMLEKKRKDFTKKYVK